LCMGASGTAMRVERAKASRLLDVASGWRNLQRIFAATEEPQRSYEGVAGMSLRYGNARSAQHALTTLCSGFGVA